MMWSVVGFITLMALLIGLALQSGFLFPKRKGAVSAGKTLVWGTLVGVAAMWFRLSKMERNTQGLFAPINLGRRY